MKALYGALGVLFVLLAGYQFRRSHELFFGGQSRVSMPLAVTWTGVINEAPPGSPVQANDEIVSLNGLPFKGWTQIARAQRLASPGDLCHLQIRRAGQIIPIDLVWQPTEPPSGSGLPFVAIIFINLIAPWFALLFGFFVVLARPREPMAWLFLFLCLSFGHMADQRGASWEDGVRQVVRFTTEFLSGLFAPMFLLLGVYFGYAYPNRYVRSGAWVIASLQIAWFAFDAAYAVALREDAAATLRWLPLKTSLERAATASIFASLGVMFWLLFRKYFRTSDADIKRRIGILLTCFAVSLTPGFFYFFALEFLQLPQIPWIYRIITYTFMGLTPMGLAYVILVHRALDVKVVLRSGLQYALARGGVWIVQGIVAVIGIIWAVRFMEEQHHLGASVHAAILASYAALILGIRWVSEPLFRWIDRRFFRDAYSTEQVMAELAEKVRDFVEPDELFGTLGERLSQALHVREIAFFLANGSRFQPAYAIGTTGGAFALDSAPVKRLTEERQPIQLFLDDQSCWCYAPEVDAADRENLLRLRTQVLLPLTSARGLVGFASLGPKLSQAPYSRNDLRLLESVASQAGLALENGRLAESLAQEAAQKERVHRELEIATDVQRQLFPQKPLTLPDVEVAGMCRPAQAVGGDYYDFFPLENGAVGVAVGDVAGKGVGAAIVMATVQASLRTQVLDADPDLGGLMAKLNRVVYEASPRNRFVTIFYGQYHRDTRVLAYVNAGHNQPYVVSRRTGLQRLVTTGVAAGLQRKRRFAQENIRLEPGDLLVAFTDGITEAMNEAREEYGEERLAAVLTGMAGRAPAEVIAAVLASVDAFTAGALQHDDMTLAVLRVNA